MKRKIVSIATVGVCFFLALGCSHGYHYSQRERIEVHRSEPPIEVAKTFLTALSSSNQSVLRRIAQKRVYREPAARKELMKWMQKVPVAQWKEQFLEGGKAVVTLGSTEDNRTRQTVAKLRLVDTSREKGSYYAWKVTGFEPGRDQ